MAFSKEYYEERRIGVYRDWYGIILSRLDKERRDYANIILKMGVPVEIVNEITGLSEEERKVKNKGYWKRICACINKNNKMTPVCFANILDERLYEIILKLIKFFGVWH